ncbi:exodeoxyribonuclease X C-terminal domain-containing protein [Tepidimicrobium xylanilyticum]|uniref:Exodeoxyribonuclease X-like C-terminal domain-containing protein n=1 Tax=Tepidimicrobium xylanilyticum TaxID=1123352 RepID=A0A1H2YJ03_9FIRM|nr:hypothetical protein [Tepidimicrobium xylanilyticum]SDX05183.1 hypothetical protein SAMN05660923_01637 [Tepidimicrobium xylanilyticum]
MNNNQIVVQESSPIMIIDGIKLDRVQQSMDKIHQFQRVIQNTLVEGHDYGQAFYGASKPSLLKPGAEKILMLLGLSSEYEIIEKIQDYDEGFFAYTVRCVLKRGNQVITEGLGHCNSKEKKYESDKQDKFMLGNTCLKMAKKRAQVDAALTVGSLSDIFTQDLEDMAEFNQSERIETMNLNDAENMKINFGKHRGKTLGQIYKESPDYVEWLAGKANDQALRKAASILLNQKNNAINNLMKAVDATLEKHHGDSPIDMEAALNDPDLPWNDSDENEPF